MSYGAVDTKCKEIKISHSDISTWMEINERSLRKLAPSLRKRIIEISESGEALRTQESIERLARSSGIPIRYLFEQLSFFDDEDNTTQKINQTLQDIIKQIDAQVLYLPTYRRIEQELASVVDWLDPDDLRRQKMRPSKPKRDQAYIELVEFGMQDVEVSIEEECNRLKEFQSKNLDILTLSHFGDIVSSAYSRREDIQQQQLDNLSDSEIKAVLDRVNESIVDKPKRDEWFKVIHDARLKNDPSEREQIICHYFLKILDFQKSLQAEESKIATFCKICSEYILDKEFVYDSTSFKFYIRPKFEYHAGEPVQLSDLSSGEKQIVSLFSHLYLSGQSRYFVLIDEPELSLSVPWQKRFLVDIKNGSFCAGLVAVTHSPFIYDNELKPYAHSLGEFASL